jgi:hypothetical protein
MSNMLGGLWLTGLIFTLGCVRLVFQRVSNAFFLENSCGHDTVAIRVLSADQRGLDNHNTVHVRCVILECEQSC